jgi:hypothetical protein
VSIYSPLANQIAGWLLVCALLTVGGCKALYTACVARRTDPVARHHITQRGRYGMMAIGLLCSVPTLFVAIYYGISNIVQVLDLMIEISPTFGWPITIAAVLAALYPILAIFSLPYIYFRPSPFAFRRGEMYAPTVLVRDGDPRDSIMTPWVRSEHVRTDRFGKQRRTFLPGNADHFDTTV